MAATQAARDQGNESYVVRVLRDMNSVLTTAEDWEERVGSVLQEMHNLLPMDLAAVLLTGREHRFLVFLTLPLESILVETIKTNVMDHYRLLTEQPVQADAFSTSFLGPHAPQGAISERPDGHGKFRNGSYLSLPLLGVDEIVGLIHVFSLETNSYGEEDLNLFSEVSAKLGNYLSHVNLHRVLEEYDRERDAFTAEVLHELKSPLTSASGFAQLLLRQLTASTPPSRAEEVEMIERIRQQLQRVVELSDSVLDVTRVRAGWMSLERERVDMGALVRRMAEAIQATTDEQTISVDVTEESTVWGDEKRLEQVLRNLLSNAIKFSPKGGTVVVEVTPDDERKNVTVSVRDQGMGIPKEQQEHLFEKFYRADSATSRRIGGSGLGLYISSEIVRRHGGWIRVESEEGKGSTFSFALPAATESA